MPLLLAGSSQAAISLVPSSQHTYMAQARAASARHARLRISSHVSRVYSGRCKAYSAPMLDAIGLVRLEVGCKGWCMPPLDHSVLHESAGPVAHRVLGCSKPISALAAICEADGKGRQRACGPQTPPSATRIWRARGEVSTCYACPHDVWCRKIQDRTGVPTCS